MSRTQWGRSTHRHLNLFLIRYLWIQNIIPVIRWVDVLVDSARFSWERLTTALHLGEQHRNSGKTHLTWSPIDLFKEVSKSYITGKMFYHSHLENFKNKIVVNDRSISVVCDCNRFHSFLYATTFTKKCTKEIPLPNVIWLFFLSCVRFGMK